MTIHVTSANPTLIADEVASLLIQPLEQASTFLAAGPRIIDTNQPLRVPRVASGVTAGFIGEGEQITDDSVSFDEVTLLPSSLKSLKVLVRVSNELVRTSVVGLDAVLRQRLVLDVARALDAAMWDGPGTDDTITGILQQDGIATGTLDLTDPDSLIDGLATAQANHTNPSAWVMTSASFAALRKLKVGESDARYLFDPSSIQNGTALTLMGLPVIVTDHVPDVGGAARVALVDFSHVIVARDLDAEVRVLDQTWADFDSVGIRVVTRFDVGLTQPEAVTVLTEAGGGS